MWSAGATRLRIVSCGPSLLQAALVRYSSFSVREGLRSNTYGQFEVLDVAWDADLGAATLDALLIDHFAAEFNAALGDGRDVRDFPKAMAKLKKQVRRQKGPLRGTASACPAKPPRAAPKTPAGLEGGRSADGRATPCAALCPAPCGSAAPCAYARPPTVLPFVRLLACLQAHSEYAVVGSGFGVLGVRS
jgi:Hsp70 protein